MKFKRILVEVDRWILMEIKIKRPIKKSSVLKILTSLAYKP